MDGLKKWEETAGKQLLLQSTEKKTEQALHDYIILKSYYKSAIQAVESKLSIMNEEYFLAHALTSVLQDYARQRCKCRSRSG